MTRVFKSALLRFLRGGLAGAVSTMTALLLFTGSTWNELATWLSSLAFSGIVGFVSGGLLALDKYLRDSK